MAPPILHHEEEVSRRPRLSEWGRAEQVGVTGPLHPRPSAMDPDGGLGGGAGELGKAGDRSRRGDSQLEEPKGPSPRSSRYLYASTGTNSSFES